jgi:hypothetical protein
MAFDNTRWTHSGDHRMNHAYAYCLVLNIKIIQYNQYRWDK